MTYKIVIPKPVQKQLDALPKRSFDRIIEKVMELKTNPRPRGSIKLKKYENECRIRIGTYRLRYAVDEKKSAIVLLHCAHRKNAYR